MLNIRIWIQAIITENKPFTSGVLLWGSSLEARVWKSGSDNTVSHARSCQRSVGVNYWGELRTGAEQTWCATSLFLSDAIMQNIHKHTRRSQPSTTSKLVLLAASYKYILHLNHTQIADIWCTSQNWLNNHQDVYFWKSIRQLLLISSVLNPLKMWNIKEEMCRRWPDVIAGIFANANRLLHC